MSQRLIPRRVKTQLEIVRGLTLGDIIYLMLCGGVLIAFIYSNLPYRIYIGIAVFLLMASLLISANGVKFYVSAGYAFRFFAFSKNYVKKSQLKKIRGNDIRNIIPFEKIEGPFIYYGGYYGAVVELQPIEFFLLNEGKQEAVINSVANALRRMTDGQSGSIYKLVRPMIFDEYITKENERIERVQNNFDIGVYNEEEIDARDQIFDSRIDLLEAYNDDAKIYKEHYYIAVYDKDKELLLTTVNGMVSSLMGTSNPISSKVLQGRELAVFLKSSYTKFFDEREVNLVEDKYLVNWICPDKLKFRMADTVIDDKVYKHFCISDYPMSVGNAWGYKFFAMEGVNVCVNFSTMNRLKAEKMIDNTILEIEGQLANSYKQSQRMEKENVIDTVKQLLADLKNQNESLFDVNMHIICDNDHKKQVKAAIKESGFKYNDMFGRQVDAFISSTVSSRENIKDCTRGMQTTSLAGIFPFISSAMQDPGGLYLGYNKYPVFVDFFQRNSERVNSNLVIIGRSGSGKSFATKLLLAQLAADDTKVFVCDPENEYEKLAKNLGGKIIDVGSGSKARFNPLHVMATLEDEEGEQSDSFVTHLQFLEEFFKMILEGISPDALETLNRLCVELYESKNINSKTNITSLKPEDFPTFDDLYELAIKKHDASTDDYLRMNYKIIINYISKFATGGRNAGLWNGPTNISTNENFIIFSFRSLLANRNQSVARAQMLLVFKYLDNEIIKNRDFNIKNNAQRKIIVTVDEAHVFINPKYPIALDFMYQMAKRIRKYNGMQIIITQNLQDFMGSEDIIRQSSAIIAASQYSMIFSLSPNDVTELVKLYKNAGEINEGEQDEIATAGRGYCFFISGPVSRTSFQIEALDEIKNLFEY